MDYSYSKNTPMWMKVLFGITLLVATIPIVNLIYLGARNLTFAYADELSLTGLGQLGDFFGGHTAAFASSMSLLVVLFFTFHQAKQQHQFFKAQQEDTKQQSQRDLFLQGINLITQWDLASPGCDQCMRLLDYYGRVAIESQDRELSLLLNTVITAKIRQNLQGKNQSFKSTNYPYACKLLEKIAVLRKEDGLKARLEPVADQIGNLSTP